MSPLNRDPETDGDNYGCFTAKANRKVAKLVEEVRERIEGGGLTDDEAIVDAVRPVLEGIGAGSTDTVVKENVFQALAPAIRAAGIEFDPMLVYGW